jgi:hypothetical protein
MWIVKGSDAEGHFKNRQTNTPEDRSEGQTFSLRPLPSQKPKAGQHASSLVLP